MSKSPSEEAARLDHPPVPEAEAQAAVAQAAIAQAAIAQATIAPVPIAPVAVQAAAPGVMRASSKTSPKMPCACNTWELASVAGLLKANPGYRSGVRCDSCNFVQRVTVASKMHIFHCKCNKDVCLPCMEALHKVLRVPIQLGATLPEPAKALKVGVPEAQPWRTGYARMLFAASGRDNFRDLEMPAWMLEQASQHDQACTNDHKTMLAALQADERFRKSSFVQHLLTTSPQHTTKLLTACQQYACQQAGFQDLDVGLAALRSVVKRFNSFNCVEDLEKLKKDQDQPTKSSEFDELLQAVMWLRENRSQQCTLKVGDQIQNTTMFACSLSSQQGVQSLIQTTLMEACRKARLEKGSDSRVVVVAGSCT